MGDEELDKNIVRREVETVNKKLSIYKNDSVGSMTLEKENGRVGIFQAKQYLKSKH